MLLNIGQTVHPDITIINMSSRTAESANLRWSKIVIWNRFKHICSLVNLDNKMFCSLYSLLPNRNQDWFARGPGNSQRTSRAGPVGTQTGTGTKTSQQSTRRQVYGMFSTDPAWPQTGIRRGRTGCTPTGTPQTTSTKVCCDVMNLSPVYLLLVW